jgi:hypothetical protein
MRRGRLERDPLVLPPLAGPRRGRASVHDDLEPYPPNATVLAGKSIYG